MGGAFSTRPSPINQVWKIFLEEREINYLEQQLFDLILWINNKGIELTNETAFNINNWINIGEQMLNAALKGDKKAINALKPRKVILKLLKEIKADLSSSSMEENVPTLCGETILTGKTLVDGSET